MNLDIRWKQRFSNLKKAYEQLTEFMEKSELNKFEVQGLIQCFEYTFELSWKTIKDYLEFEGYDVKTPRDTIKKAFQVGIIDDGSVWLDALEKRNLMSHTYNENITNQTEQLIKTKYYAMMKKVIEFFSNTEWFLIMRFGLKESELETICEYLSRYPEIEKATIFGSRAKGNYKNGSDIDIALYGKNVTLDTITSVNYILNEESPFIYYFDALSYEGIENKELKEHIDRVCIEIYNLHCQNPWKGNN